MLFADYLQFDFLKNSFRTQIVKQLGSRSGHFDCPGLGSDYLIKLLADTVI